MKLIDKKGFTMLEMMIVVFVFLTGVVGAYGVINSFYVTSVYSSNRFTATYLSQEGIELVKNLRDNNLINGVVDWKTNIIGDCSFGSVCKIDYNDPFLTSDPLGTFLKKDANNFYNYEDSLNTIFKRKIVISDLTDHINIKVETEWYKNGAINGSVIIEDNLYEYWQ